jgi:biotin transport system substrate-specific component
MAYILLGAFGLPVFAGFKGGIHVLTGMTGGFIMAYPIMAFVTSIFYQLPKKIKLTAFNKNITHVAVPTLGMIVSLLICYLIGTLWFSYISGSTYAYAFSVCVLPFIAFDILKIILAVASGTILRRIMRQII